MSIHAISVCLQSNIMVYIVEAINLADGLEDKKSEVEDINLSDGSENKKSENKFDKIKTMTYAEAVTKNK